MLVLWEQDAAADSQPIGVGELGERLYLDSGTLTPLLKRMATAGLVARTRGTDDERRVTLSLTPAGRALQGRAADVPRQVACATGCRLNEISQLTTQLQTLRDNVAGQLKLAA
jgi:DNA-binding MarR family transcriptional regulator